MRNHEGDIMEGGIMEEAPGSCLCNPGLRNPGCAIQDVESLLWNPGC